VVHLLQLAQRVRVEVALAGQQVELLQEPLGLLGKQLAADELPFDLAPQTATTSVSSGMDSRSRLSIPIFSVAVDDGHPLHEPFMCR